MTESSESPAWFKAYKDELYALILSRIKKKMTRDDYYDSVVSLHETYVAELIPYSKFKPFYLAVHAGNILRSKHITELDNLISITSVFGFFILFSKFLDRVIYQFFQEITNLGLKEFLAKHFASQGFNYRALLEDLTYDKYSVTEAHLRHVEDHAQILHLAMIRFGMIGIHHGLGYILNDSSLPYERAFMLGYLPFQGKYHDYYLYSFVARFAANDLPSSLVLYQDYMERASGISLGDKPFQGLSYFTNRFRILDSPLSGQFLDKVARNFILHRKGLFDLTKNDVIPFNVGEIKSLLRSPAVKYVGFLKSRLNRYHLHYFILHEPTPQKFFILYNLFQESLFWDYLTTMDIALIRIWNPFLNIDDYLNALGPSLEMLEMKPLFLDFNTPVRDIYKTANFARIPFRYVVVRGEGRSLFPFSMDFIEYKLNSLDLERLTTCKSRDIFFERLLSSEITFSCPLFSLVFYPPHQTRTFYFEFSSPYAVEPLDNLLQAVFPYGASMRPMSMLVQIPYSSFSDSRVTNPNLSPYSTRMLTQIGWDNYEENEKGIVIAVDENRFPISVWFTHGYVQEFIRWYNFSFY